MGDDLNNVPTAPMHDSVPRGPMPPLEKEIRAGFRGSTWRLVSRIAAAAMVVSLALTLPIIIAGYQTTNGTAPAAARIILLLLLLLAIYFARRLLLVRVILRDEGIIIVNVWHTHRIWWADVEAIELGLRTGRRRQMSCCLLVVTAAGIRPATASLLPYQNRSAAMGPLTRTFQARGITVRDRDPKARQL